MVANPVATFPSSLSFTILIFISHCLANSWLLTAWNPLRCAYWNQQECTADEGWMANWLSLSHLHVTTTLACMLMLAKSTPKEEEKLAFLICTIMMTYLVEGAFTLDRLDWRMASLQIIIFLGIMGWILCATYKDANAVIPYQPTLPCHFPRMKKLASSGISKCHTATIVLGMHVVSSVLRLVDMKFGSGRNGYMGDTSR